ncbi:GspH/FimT family pseudopilin [Luteimonas pelagia]
MTARHARGVSLLEMLLVVALIAALSLVAAAAYSGGMAGMQLRSTVKDIGSNLRYTRTRAIATGEPQRFTIDPATRTWTAPNGRDGEIPDSLEVSFTGARELQPAEGVGAIVFWPDGAASGGRITVSRDGAAWDIDVAWMTGEVRLRRLEAGE